jgi:glycosyltransferase involved in cell wall biosynthesis
MAQLPGLDRQLARRAITNVPAELVQPRWGWDLVRTAVSVAGAGPGTQDWLWERAERSLDAATARLLERPDVGGYLGVEFGALASLRAAKSLGKPGVLAFLSPHHQTRARWVEPELARFPEIETDVERRLRALSVERDRLRDEEARTADAIVTGSSFTTKSLVDAGVPQGRILTVPLGGPVPLDAAMLPTAAPNVQRFVFAGSVAVHKGIHHLLEAWTRLAPAQAELHVYGRCALPRDVLDRWLSRSAGTVVLHGSVPSVELHDAYRHASALVLPTLADGFGQVIADALAHGLPVTTTNAGRRSGGAR